MLLAGIAAGCRRSAAGPAAAGAEEPPAAARLIVRRGDLATRVLLSGQLTADEGVVVVVPRTPSWRVPIRWLAADGARVVAGDPIAELDNSTFTGDLEEKRLHVLDTAHQLEQRRLEVAIDAERAAFEVEQHKVDLAKARRQAQVPVELIGQQAADKRRVEVRKAEIALDKAVAALEVKRRGGEADLAQIQLDLDRSRRDVASAEQAIRDLSIKAPAAGTVVLADHPFERRKLRVGDEIWVGAELVRLPDFARLTLHAGLPDVDQGALVPGQAVTAWLDAYPDQPFPARVADVAPIAREEKGSSLRRFFQVILLPEPGALDPTRVRPGMSVKVEARSEPRRDVLLVPRAALAPAAEDAGLTKARVRLAAGGEAEVELGVCDAQECEATGGVAEGAVLVARGHG